MTRDQPSAAEVRGQSLQPVEAARAGVGGGWGHSCGAWLGCQSPPPALVQVRSSILFVTRQPQSLCPQLGHWTSQALSLMVLSPSLPWGPLERAVGVWSGLGGCPVKSSV